MFTHKQNCMPENSAIKTVLQMFIIYSFWQSSDDSMITIIQYFDKRTWHLIPSVWKYHTGGW